MVETLFAVLVTLQFLVMVLHDWLDIPGWTHGRQVYAAVGPVKIWIGTVVNASLPGAALFFAIRYWHQPKPWFVWGYWIFYCAMAVMGAVQSWWWPYYFGTDQKTKDLYAKMYAGTWQVLPARGDNPRPNVLHLYFHALLLVTLGLSIVLWVRR